eukprot:CAMPEP_0119363950 /NCGR_PEP_ID=MMETSP1334-20130426/10875_1 /TAXON_ID=127549 /ORGANISM="Calcidiscus leptoporus, Strain RCC1130" /LENGTH=60 /DNA_ID=CAMNT_0007379539 /DNA_START=131 /DNA_END=314 /DNA_ORIENTATION=+
MAADALFDVSAPDRLHDQELEEATDDILMDLFGPGPEELFQDEEFEELDGEGETKGKPRA